MWMNFRGMSIFGECSDGFFGVTREETSGGVGSDDEGRNDGAAADGFNPESGIFLQIGDGAC